MNTTDTLLAQGVSTSPAAARAGPTTSPASGAGHLRGTTPAPGRRPPLTPREGWLSDGRHVLRFRPTRWERRVQRLEITTDELLPDEAIPLLKSRRELRRREALKLCSEKRKAGWKPCTPQW